MKVEKAIEILKDMRENTLNGDIYQDPERYENACALTLGIQVLEFVNVFLLPYFPFQQIKN